MVCQHHASSQGSRPASRIEQHAIANEIVTGGQGWVWPADRSVAQDPAEREGGGVLQPQHAVHVYQHDRVPRLSSLRDEDLTLSPESYSVEAQLAENRSLSSNSNHYEHGTHWREVCGHSLVDWRVTNVCVGTGQLTWRTVQVILQQFDLILWLRTKIRYGGG